MAKGKRIVSEVQKIHVKKFAYVQDRPEQGSEVVQKVKTSDKSGGPLGGIFGLGRKKEKKNPTEKHEQFIEALDKD